MNFSRKQFVWVYDQKEIPVPIFRRIYAVHLRDKMADEGFLIEGSEIGTQEIIPCTE